MVREKRKEEKRRSQKRYKYRLYLYCVYCIHWQLAQNLGLDLVARTRLKAHDHPVIKLTGRSLFVYLYSISISISIGLSCDVPYR